jgi:hypothetical protein
MCDDENIKSFALPNVSYDRFKEYICTKRTDSLIATAVGDIGSPQLENVLSSPHRVSPSQKAAMVVKKLELEHFDHITVARDNNTARNERVKATIVSTMNQEQSDLFGTVERKCRILSSRLKEANDLLQKSVEKATQYQLLLKQEQVSTNRVASRLTLLTHAFHEQNPTWATHQLGQSWKSFKITHQCLFPDVNCNVEVMNVFQPVFAFEKSIMTRMKFRKGHDNSTIAEIFTRCNSSTHNYIVEWSKRWGTAGEDLSILDTPDFLFRHMIPQSFVDGKLEMVGLLVDGKDVMVFTDRNHSGLTRAMWSDKVHHSAFRWLNWGLACGLSVEHTVLYYARVSESKLVQLWGSSRHHTPMYTISKTYYDQLCKIGYVPREKGIDPVQAGQLFGQTFANKGKDQQNGEDDINADGEDFLDLATADVGKKRKGTVVTDAVNFLSNNMKKSKAGKKTQYTIEDVHKQNEDILKMGPNEGPERKLLQLERHQRLHVQFESGNVEYCLLAYYLLVMTDVRLQQIKILKGKVKKADMIASVTYRTRLSKCPHDRSVLADKGFAKTALYYEFLNEQLTPSFIDGRNQFTKDEISADLVKCQLRYGSETSFARVTNENIMQDTVPTAHFSILDSANHWAHANINLHAPFHKPIGYDAANEKAKNNSSSTLV